MCREGRRLMKFVIQRVKEASVKVDGEYTGKIKNGYLVLIGVGHEDTKEEAEKSSGEILPRDTDRKSTRLNSSHASKSRMPSSA